MIIWHTTAILELQDIYDYIFSKSPQNAEMVISEIEILVQSIANMPFKYPQETSCEDQNIRFVPIWNYKIIYQIDTINIVILSVFNTSQGFVKITS